MGSDSQLERRKIVYLPILDYSNGKRAYRTLNVETSLVECIAKPLGSRALRERADRDVWDVRYVETQVRRHDACVEPVVKQ